MGIDTNAPELANRIYAAAENLWTAHECVERAARLVSNVDRHHPLLVEWEELRRRLEDSARRSDGIADTIVEHAEHT